MRDSLQQQFQHRSTRTRVATLVKDGDDSLERRVKYAIKHDANFLFLQLDCSGGETAEVASAANMLRDLTDDNGRPLRTVAWIPTACSWPATASATSRSRL